jgi:hypothetical protein
MEECQWAEMTDSYVLLGNLRGRNNWGSVAILKDREKPHKDAMKK